MTILYEDGTVVRVDGTALQKHLRARHAEVWAGKGRSSDDTLGLMCDSHQAVGCKKWSLSGQDVLQGAVLAGLSRAPLFDLSAYQTSTYDVFGVGKYPVLAKYVCEEDSVQFNAGELVSKVASSVVSFAKSWWGGSGSGGGSSAGTADKASIHEVRHDKENGRVVYPGGSISDDTRAALSVCLSPDDVLAAVPDSYGRVMVVDVARMTVVRMFKGYREAQCAWLSDPFQPRGWLLAIYAPRRGIVELWRCRHGPRVAAANIGENCLLLPSGPALVGEHAQTSGGAGGDDNGNASGRSRIQVDCAILRPTGVLESVAAPVSQEGSDDDVSCVDEEHHTTREDILSDSDSGWLQELENALQAYPGHGEASAAQELIAQGMTSVSSPAFFSGMQLVLQVIANVDTAHTLTLAAAEAASTGDDEYWRRRARAITLYQRLHTWIMEYPPAAGSPVVDVSLDTFIAVIEEQEGLEEEDRKAGIALLFTPLFEGEARQRSESVAATAIPTPDADNAEDGKKEEEEEEGTDAGASAEEPADEVVVEEEEQATCADVIAQFLEQDMSPNDVQELFVAYFFQSPLRVFFRHRPATSPLTSWLAHLSTANDVHSAGEMGADAVEPAPASSTNTAAPNATGTSAVPSSSAYLSAIFQYCRSTSHVTHAIALVPFCLAAVERAARSQSGSEDVEGNVEEWTAPWKLLQSHLELVLSISERLNSVAVDVQDLTVAALVAGRPSLSRLLAQAEVSLGLSLAEMSRYIQDGLQRRAAQQQQQAEGREGAGDGTPEAGEGKSESDEEEEETRVMSDLVTRWGSHVSELSIAMHRTDILFSQLLRSGDDGSQGFVTAIEALSAIEMGRHKRALIHYLFQTYLAGALYKLASVVDNGGKFPSERSCLQHFQVPLATVQQFLTTALSCIDALKEQSADEEENGDVDGDGDGDKASAPFPWLPSANRDPLLITCHTLSPGGDDDDDDDVAGTTIISNAIAALVRILSTVGHDKEFANFRFRSTKLHTAFPDQLALLRHASDPRQAASHATLPNSGSSEAAAGTAEASDSQHQDEVNAARFALLSQVLSRAPAVAFALAHELSFPTRTMDRLRCEHVRILYERQQDPLGEEALLGIADSEHVGSLLLQIARARLCVILHALHKNKKAHHALATVPADTAAWINAITDVPGCKLPRAPSLAATKALVQRIMSLLQPGTPIHHQASSLLQTATALLRDLT
eukprot:TRINITY_DN3564_c0_g1_i1.p1 TRINITY_DN3564_c0_g1~~TRINITY_DN3564_c0_g1_i1.p1  ORF type:complete len:1388 (-),score=318.13 TRINITY_DN3564_c0_g1_i1:76-3723(-)